MSEGSEYTRLCNNRRNKRIRAETDYNRVLNEYILVKYEPIAEEFAEFYDSLRSKYPEKHVYKGSKKFRHWVRSEIGKHESNKNTEEQQREAVVRDENDADVSEAVVRNENDADVSEAVVRNENDANVSEAMVRNENDADVSEAVVNVPDTLNVVSLAEIVDNSIGANVVVPPLENVIANGLPQELEELDALIGNIIADIESQCDEGISLSPHHELEPEPLYYEGEIEGLDDIELDLPLNLLEAELEIELENF